MTIASLAPVAGATLAASAISTNGTIPTGGTIAVVTNYGAALAFVTLGTSAALAATLTGLPILPGTQAVLTIGSNTTIAAVTLAGVTGLNVTVGN
jgi:hypothetical protein